MIGCRPWSRNRQRLDSKRGGLDRATICCKHGRFFMSPANLCHSDSLCSIHADPPLTLLAACRTMKEWGGGPKPLSSLQLKAERWNTSRRMDQLRPLSRLTRLPPQEPKTKYKVYQTSSWKRILIEARLA